MECVERGYKIRYSEVSEVWECVDLRLKHEKLSKLREKIRKVSNGMVTFKNPLIVYGYASGSVCDIQILSFAHPENNYNRVEDMIWIKKPNGSRSKEKVTDRYGASLHLKTDENNAIFKELAEIAEESTKLYERRKLAEAKLKPLTVQDIEFALEDDRLAVEEASAE